MCTVPTSPIEQRFLRERQLGVELLSKAFFDRALPQDKGVGVVLVLLRVGNRSRQNRKWCDPSQSANRVVMRSVQTSAFPLSRAIVACRPASVKHRCAIDGWGLRSGHRCCIIAICCLIGGPETGGRREANQSASRFRMSGVVGRAGGVQ